MKIRALFTSSCLLAAFTYALSAQAAMDGSPKASEASKAEITVLYDAFGKPSAMKKDWGFSALIEYRGKRILFDTGNNADIFAHNAKAKGIDLSKLDFVVVSHRHGDHTSGLNHLLRVNPDVTIFAPQALFGLSTGSIEFGGIEGTGEALPLWRGFFCFHPSSLHHRHCGQVLLTFAP